MARRDGSGSRPGRRGRRSLSPAHPEATRARLLIDRMTKPDSDFAPPRFLLVTARPSASPFTDSVTASSSPRTSSPWPSRSETATACPSPGFGISSLTATIPPSSRVRTRRLDKSGSVHHRAERPALRVLKDAADGYPTILFDGFAQVPQGDSAHDGDGTSRALGAVREFDTARRGDVPEHDRRQ